MKMKSKASLALFLSLVLLAGMLPLYASAGSAGELTATEEGVVIRDTVFTGVTRISGCFGNDKIPSITFENCSFETIEAVAGGDWDLLFEGNNTITGQLRVVNETGNDLRRTDDCLHIDNPPAGTELVAPEVRASVRMRTQGESVLFNGAAMTVKGGEGNLYAAQDFAWMPFGVITKLDVNGASRIALGDDTPFGNLNVVVDEVETELALNLTEAFPEHLLGISAGSEVRCTCVGEEKCTCTCCQEKDCKGFACGWRCRGDGFCDECRDVYTPTLLQITGSVNDKGLLLSGLIDVSALTGNGDLTAETWYDGASFSIGTHSLFVRGNARSPITIAADPGAEIFAEADNVGRLLVNDFTLGDLHIFDGGSVYVDTADDGIDYALSLDGEPVAFTKEIIAGENKTHLMTENANIFKYKLTATKGGVTLHTPVFPKNLLLATSDDSFYSDREYTEDVEIRCVGEGNDRCRINIDNCTFGGDVVLRFDGRRAEVSFGENCSIAGTLRVESDGDFRFADEEAFFWNLPDNTSVTTDRACLSLCGNRENTTLFMDGARVQTGDETGDYDIHVGYACRAPHDLPYDEYDHSRCDPAEQGQQLFLGGNIASFRLSDGCATDCVILRGVYGDVSGVLEQTAGDGQTLYLRTERPFYDNPEDDRDFKDDARMVLTGSVANHSMELIGRFDISGLAFTESERDRIRIGTWDADADVIIGSHAVEVCGGEYPAAITAESGAFIRIEDERQTVNVNNGAIDMKQPHIFGNQNNYGVFIGTANPDIQYRLFCGGEEVEMTPEYFAEEDKTHLHLAENRDHIGDWRLQATNGGVTVEMRLAHKEWLCEGHVFGGWSVLREATCTEEGFAFRRCIYCDMEETSLIFPAHRFTARTVNEAYLKTAASCTLPAAYYMSCAFCGQTSHDSPEENTFFDGTPLGHSPSAAIRENVVPATCAAEGSFDNVVTCSVCGEVLNKTTVVTPKTAHTPAAAVIENNIEPTFDAAGSFDSVVYCVDCHAEINRSTVVVPALRHTAAEPVQENIVPADCAHSGSFDSVVRCLFCDEELSRTAGTIPVNDNHSFGGWTQTLAPTAGAEGTETRTCSVCDTNENRSIPALTELTVTETEAIVLSAAGDIYIAPGTTAAALLQQATPGAAVLDKDGNAVASDGLLGTGMRLVLLSGEEITDAISIILPGDIDGNCAITAADARLALRASVGLESLSDIQTLAGLVNGAKTLSAAEARLILRASVSLEDPAAWLAAVA